MNKLNKRNNGLKETVEMYTIPQCRCTCAYCSCYCEGYGGAGVYSPNTYSLSSSWTSNASNNTYFGR